MDEEKKVKKEGNKDYNLDKKKDMVMDRKKKIKGKEKGMELEDYEREERILMRSEYF